MVKEPRPGRVKTRLGAGLGMVSAAWWYRHQTARLMRRLGRDPRWRACLAVSPDVEGRASRIWPRDLPRTDQGPGDLGQRMARLIRTAPPGPVVIIGSDIPGIAQTDIAAAFRALGTARTVFGPAPDGGYWLVGLARTGGRVPAYLFQNVRWSTESALSDSVATVEGPVAYLRELQDIDTLRDFRAARPGSAR